MGKALLTIVFLFLASIGLSQESGTIKGHIMDGEMQDEPLLFAQVSLIGTSFNTETNFQGNFEFDHIKPGEYILAINYLGYETLEVPITVKNDLLTIVDRSLEAKSVGAVEISANEINSGATSGSSLITSGSDR